MRLKYLGTAAAEGWPGLFCNCEFCNKARELGGKDIRSRQQALINEDLLIDFGPDTYMHATVHNLNFSKVSTLLITHSHNDHFAPQDLAIRGGCYSHNMHEESLHIYSNDAVFDIIDQTRTAAEAIEENVISHFVPPFEPFTAGKYTITALLANHNPKENCYIYIINDGQKSLLYGNDTGIFPEATFEYLKNIRFDLISLDCTCQKIDCAEGHMGLLSNARVKDRLIAQGSADQNTLFVITHFSHNGGWLHDELQAEADKYDFVASYDGMEIEI